jgi:hypothetical protein
MSSVDLRDILATVIARSEADEAIHSSSARRDGLLRGACHPAALMRPSFARKLSLENRGRREGRVLNAPAASRAKVKKHTSKPPQVRRNNPTFPAQWFTAYSALSCPCFLAAVACASYRRLDPSVAGSGPHAFAIREHSAVVFGAARVHRIPPRVS